MLHSLQILTVIFGFGVVAMLLWISREFFKSGQALGKAIGWLLIAFAFACCVTIWFSLTSVFDVYNSMTPIQAMFLRWLIFGSGAAAAFYLRYKLLRLWPCR